MKILFAGEGGQGVQVIAEILALAAFLENKKVSYIPNFGVEQRGGVSIAFLIVDQKPIAYPKFEKADFLAILSDRFWERVRSYQSLKTKIIRGPAVKNGLKSSFPPKVWNIVVLRRLNELGKIVKPVSLIEAMEKRFSKQFKKDPKLRELDIKALTSCK